MRLSQNTCVLLLCCMQVFLCLSSHFPVFFPSFLPVVPFPFSPLFPSLLPVVPFPFIMWVTKGTFERIRTQPKVSISKKFHSSHWEFIYEEKKGHKFLWLLFFCADGSKWYAITPRSSSHTSHIDICTHVIIKMRH